MLTFAKMGGVRCIYCVPRPAAAANSKPGLKRASVELMGYSTFRKA